MGLILYNTEKDAFLQISFVNVMMTLENLIVAHLSEVLGRRGDVSLATAQARIVPSLGFGQLCPRRGGPRGHSGGRSGCRDRVGWRRMVSTNSNDATDSSWSSLELVELRRHHLSRSTTVNMWHGSHGRPRPDPDPGMPRRRRRHHLGGRHDRGLQRRLLIRLHAELS